MITDELQAFFDNYTAAYQAADASASTNMFLAKGELHSPYAPPAVGRQAVQELHREWVAELSGRKSMIVVTAESSGDLAWCLATFSEGQVTGNGTSLCVFERRSGQWLFRICSLNSSDAVS